MSYYPSDFVDQLCWASDLVSLISEDTVLKGQGDRFMGLCPFPEHNEKTPSFSVSVSKQLYNCFGCQNSGNIFTYLQKQRGMNFTEAVEYLAHKKGLSLPKEVRFKKNLTNPNYFELSERICQFFEKQLTQAQKDHPVRAYLKKRGWPAELIQKFRLGYAPKNNSLLSFLNSKEQRLAIQLGLINRSADGRSYDNFRHRLIFPIVSIKKQVVGFGARVLDDSLPKYINSKESEIFHKGQIFYGLSESARYLRQDSFALLVEGYTDFLALWQSGFKNTVATLGTALTEFHAKLLKRYAGTVVLVFDGDTAGLRASERSLPLLLKEGLKVKILPLPQGQDPDDLIRSQGKQAFQESLDSAQDLFFFILKSKQRQKKDNLYLIEELAPVLSKVQDKSLKVIYKQRLLDLFGTDARLLGKALEEKIKQGVKTFVSSYHKPDPILNNRTELVSIAKAMDSEKLILVLCLESEDFLKAFLEQNVISYLQTKEIIAVFNKLTHKYRQSEGFNQLIHLVLNEILETHLIFKTTYPIFRESDAEGQKKIFKDCVEFLKRRQKKMEAGQLLADMKINNTEDINGLEKVFQLTKQRLNSTEQF
ncbi:MAG: DNA primase [Oligoflexia bacterium]|nr:DNA primase [Oligoflexia bacterium]